MTIASVGYLRFAWAVPCFIFCWCFIYTKTFCFFFCLIQHEKKNYSQLKWNQNFIIKFCSNFTSDCWISMISSQIFNWKKTAKIFDEDNDVFFHEHLWCETSLKKKSYSEWYSTFCWNFTLIVIRTRKFQ